MNKVFQLVLTAMLGAAGAFFVTTAGCTAETVIEDSAACQADPFSCKTCQTAEWCGGKKDRFKWICKADKTCQKVCQKTADCRTELKEVCEVGVCRPPGCGTDAECNGGQDQCIGGACAPRVQATTVASCQVLPAQALLHEGGTETYALVTRDSAGNALAYKGTVEWSVDQSGRASIASGVVTGGAEGGAVQVTAKIGGTTCTAAATNFAKVTGNKLRVIVADLLTHVPVKDAKVVVGETSVTTDASGAAEFEAPSGKVAVHVFHSTYAYVSLMDVNTKDVVVYLKPGAGAGKFTGEMTAANFANLSDLKGNIHLMLSGSSIPGNLIDIQLSTLLGDLVETKLKLSPTQQPEVPLPAGTVIGMGDTMFKGGYEILASPGVRAIWGLGGNAEFAKITAALGPALAGGSTDDINVGSILSGLLPLIEALQSGVLQGENSVAGTEVDLGGKAELGANGQPKLDADGKEIRSAVRLKLSTLLRLKILAQLPDLPTYKLGDKDIPFEGAILVGGALAQPQGFIPLGLTAGVDLKGAKDADGADIGNGKVDSVDSSIPEGTVPLRVAPMHDGLENSKYGVLALAASFSGLVSSDEDADVEVPLVLSGLVGMPGDVPFPGDAPPTFKVGEKFLSVPDEPLIEGRAFSLGNKVDGAVFHRLDIGSDKTGEWFVYFGAGAQPASFSLPMVPEGMKDRLTATEEGSTKLPQVLVQSVSLKADSGLDFDKIVEFDGRDADDLSSEINAFSVREIIRAEPK